MKIVTLIGNISNNTEIKMVKDLEIMEYTIDDMKVKSFGKIAQTAKSYSGVVVGTGEIKERQYTNKEGKTYNINEVIVNKIEQLEQTPKDNFDIKPSDFSTGKTRLESAKEMEHETEELPFY